MKYFSLRTNFQMVWSFSEWIMPCCCCRRCILHMKSQSRYGNWHVMCSLCMQMAGGGDDNFTEKNWKKNVENLKIHGDVLAGGLEMNPSSIIIVLLWEMKVKLSTSNRFEANFTWEKRRKTKCPASLDPPPPPSLAVRPVRPKSTLEILAKKGGYSFFILIWGSMEEKNLQKWFYFFFGEINSLLYFKIILYVYFHYSFFLFSALCEGVQPKVNEDVCQRHGKNNNLTVEDFL